MNTKLYVGNLADTTTEAQLRDIFGPAGHVVAVTRPVVCTTKRIRNYAFIEMGTLVEASNAI